MESVDVAGRSYNCRRTCSETYEDKWEKNWKDILPKAPEKPSDETGVWRLIDHASDWKDISENIAKIPKLRQRHYATDKKSFMSNDDINNNLLLFSKSQETSHLNSLNKRIITPQEQLAKVTMVDRSVQTDDDDDDGSLFLVIM